LKMMNWLMRIFMRRGKNKLIEFSKLIGLIKLDDGNRITVRVACYELRVTGCALRVSDFNRLKNCE